MSPQEHIQKKPIKSPQLNGSASRKSIVQNKTDKADQQPQQSQDLKLQLNHAARLGHSLSKIAAPTGSSSTATVQTKAATIGQEAPPIQQLETQDEPEQMKSEQTTHRSTSSTNSMPKAVRAKMESSFGTDFSDVNIETESTQAQQMGALAFTQGNRIHFAPGQYNPQNSSGQALLGHELTHVVQQRAGRVPLPQQSKGAPINADPSLEAEADTIGAKAAQGERVRVPGVALASLAGGTFAVQNSTKPIQCGFFDDIGNALGGVVNGIGSAVGGVAKGVGDVAGGLVSGDPLGGIVKGAGDAVGGIGQGVGDAVGGVTQGVGGLVGDVGNAVGGIGSMLSNPMGGMGMMGNMLGSVAGDVMGGVGSMLSGPMGGMGMMGNMLGGVAGDVMGGVGSMLSGPMGGIGMMGNMLGGVAGDVMGGVGSMLSGPMGGMGTGDVMGNILPDDNSTFGGMTDNDSSNSNNNSLNPQDMYDMYKQFSGDTEAMSGAAEGGETMAGAAEGGEAMAGAAEGGEAMAGLAEGGEAIAGIAEFLPEVAALAIC